MKKPIVWIITLAIIEIAVVTVALLQPVKIVALTFVDGPTPGYTEKVLDILKEKRIKATFFVTGSNAKANPNLIRRIVAEGHVIGNHSYSHISFDRLDEQGVFNELLGTQQVIHDITGHSPKFVRNPFGIEIPGSKAATRRLGLTGHVHWHYAKSEVGNDDWTCKGTVAALNFAKAATKPGAILLAHDANEVTQCPDQINWLAQYINWAQATKGYQFGLLRTGNSPNHLNGDSWVDVVPPEEGQYWNE